MIFIIIYIIRAFVPSIFFFSFHSTSELYYVILTLFVQWEKTTIPVNKLLGNNPFIVWDINLAMETSQSLFTFNQISQAHFINF